MKESWSQYLGTRYWCLQVDSPAGQHLSESLPITYSSIPFYHCSSQPSWYLAPTYTTWGGMLVEMGSCFCECLSLIPSVLTGWGSPAMFVTGSVSSEPALAYYHIALLLNDLRLALWNHMTWEIFTMLLIMAFSATCWVCKTGHVCCSPPSPQPRKYSKERCSVAFLIIQSPDLWIWKVQTDIILGWQNLVMRCWLTNRALREWRRIWKPINLIGRKV